MTNDTDKTKDKTEDKTELILGVEKPIWLATTGPLGERETKIIGWTTTNPVYDNGFIDKGSVLIFSHIYYGPDGEEGLNFMEMRPGSVSQQHTAEFNQKEIDSLIKEHAFTLLELQDIEEMSIVMGEAFIKYFDYIPGKQLSFDAKVFSPKDLYIVMGPEESKLSSHDIKVGEKISLKRLLEIYSTAVGQNLILK